MLPYGNAAPQQTASLRQALREPGSSAAVLVTLALAIGANTAIFSFVNVLLIRPFPFKDSGQLVEIHSVRGGQQGKISTREVLRYPCTDSLARPL